MKHFSYARPTTLAAALEALASSGPDARILAGGTDLVIGMRDREIQPPAVIDIKRVAELYPSLTWDGGTLTLTAAATMSQVVADDGVARHFPGLAEAAVVVGSVQIRNRATVVGNICNGSPAADTAPPLLVYDAVVNVAGSGGTRRIPIDEFIVGPGKTALAPGELAVAVEIDVPERSTGSAYERMTRRRGTDLASVTLCCLVDEVGTTRLAYGSVGPRALLKVDRSGVLADPRASDEDRSAILEEFFADASPSLKSLRASPDYRRAMLRVLGRRALARAVTRLADLQGVT